MILDFKNWLVKENGTSTACVATFAQPVIGMVRRSTPKDDDKKKKKKSH
jgi:hypothetical protein